MKLTPQNLYTISGLADLNFRFIEKYDLQNKGIIEKAILVEEFIAEIFGIKDQIAEHKQKVENLSYIHKCKKLFIERIALKKYQKTDSFKNVKITLEKFLDAEITEALYAKKVLKWIEESEKFQVEIETAAQYALYMTEHLKEDGALFNIPKKLDFTNLIQLNRRKEKDVYILDYQDSYNRDGFCLTDNGLNLAQGIDNTNYCLICHERGKDSCRTGIFDKQTANFKNSPTNVPLKGCPLDEKISEMNYLHSKGYAVAALCVVTLDNPMCAATGYRICNDCMRSCIYQKQDPVNVPGIETNVLDTVLHLPYGFEIYSLLTRWNPLSPTPLPSKDSGYRVLIAGLGPAGFTLSHYLLNCGHTIVAVDGAKIEPLPPEICGVTQNGTRIEFELIKDVEKIYEKLDDRTIWGFGGVAEYGITVRWNKNYLKIIRLLLERRKNFAMFGGIRFGSNINFSDAKNLDFDHIALCVGAGRPNIPDACNILSKGVRFASDFLMSLQLGGAFKKESIANLQIRMPVVVIGAGLTAVDAATESLAYYKVQVERFSKRYKHLIQTSKEEYVQKNWNIEEKIIAEEFITHAKAIVAEADYVKFIKKIGGVKIIYRKKLQDSPAYRLNFEEMRAAFGQGIEFIEDAVPTEVICDEFGWAKELKCIHNGKEILIPARTILIATGTKPNDVIFSEYTQECINLDDISIFGDLDKKYSGSVVSAMASAKNKYQQISQKISKNDPKFEENFLHKVNGLLRTKVLKVINLSEKIFEIIIHSPLAAKNFKPGQFYKLQNFIAGSANLEIEPIALTGAKVDKENGIISLVALEVGASSYLCKFLKENQQILLMGPTGTPTEIPKEQNILLIGGGLGNAVLFSIADAMKKNKCNITYFAGYKKLSDRFKVDEIERCADVVVWVCDECEIEKTRTQDESFCGNMIEALTNFCDDQMPNLKVEISQIDRILTIGSDSLMYAVQRFIIENKSKFKSNIKAFASINSPMQCMMKEICGQCIQKNYINGKEEYIYSCSMQDQDIFCVDFEFLNKRLSQNSLWEKLNYIYLREDGLNVK